MALPLPRQSKDRRLLRRLSWVVFLAWNLAIGASLYFNLSLMHGHGMEIPPEITRSSIISHTVIWLLGLSGIALALLRVGRHLDQRLSDLSELELSAKVFDDGLQAIVITDVRGRILRVNPMFSEITGFEPEDVIGRNIDILESDSHPPEFLAGIWRELREEGSWVGENWKLRKNGESFAAWESASAIDDNGGQHLSYIFMFQDITDRKLFSSRLEQLAHYDPLTHLPNRRLLADRVAHAIQRAGRNQDQHALLFIDLDHFKRINDTIGHTAGDHLLTVIAGRLTKCVRASDTVARLGGDEFAVLLEDIASPLDAERIAEKTLTALAEPVQLEGRDWYIGASVGISLTPRDGNDMATLLKNADTAMYRAKEDGRHCFRFFDEGMAEKAALQVARETSLRLALQNQVFSLHYQPQIDLATGAATGVEALIRWRQGDKMVSPLEFIPLAESGLPAGCLELEITESTMMVDVTRVASVLDALAAMGVGMAIDDFGTGYSSLAYLKQLPVDYLKIDRSFVRDVPKDIEDSTIVRAIVTMSRNLGMKVVAEGVETAEQMQFLRDEGCHIGQGYLISRPQPLADLTAWLQQRQAA